MDYRTIFEPLENLYVPSGWCIAKNHVFDINKQGFLSLDNKDEIFLAEDYFISSSIFYAQKSTTYFTAVVDIGCKFENENEFILNYDVNFWLYRNRKRRNKLIHSLSDSSNKASKALAIVSKMMKNFSHEELEVEGYNLQDIYS